MMLKTGREIISLLCLPFRLLLEVVNLCLWLRWPETILVARTFKPFLMKYSTRVKTTHRLYKVDVLSLIHITRCGATDNMNTLVSTVFVFINKFYKHGNQQHLLI